MREPRNIEGARAPLFDRFGRQERRGQEIASRQFLDRQALKESVLGELNRLLNTRTTLANHHREATAGTVLDYGIPDVSWVCPSSDADRQRLGEVIARKIGTYETRLADVRVTVAEFGSRDLSVQISAALRLGSFYEPVDFSLTLMSDGMRAV